MRRPGKLPFLRSVRTRNGARNKSQQAELFCGRFKSVSNPNIIRYPVHMSIDLTVFSDPQQLALFDLLILAMYADGHLTTFEDERLRELLAAMGFTERIDRQREFDAAVTRMRPLSNPSKKPSTKYYCLLRLSPLVLSRNWCLRGLKKLWPLTTM